MYVASTEKNMAIAHGNKQNSSHGKRTDSHDQHHACADEGTSDGPSDRHIYTDR